MGRSRRGSTPFRFWGTALLGVAVLLAWGDAWLEALIFLGLWVLYLLMIKVTRCRVETMRHRPCLWRVRGLLSTCEFHTGYKRSMPRLVGVRDQFLPALMWPRATFEGYERVASSPAEADTASVPSRRGLEAVGVLIAGGSLLVAVVGVARDFVAG